MKSVAPPAKHRLHRCVDDWNGALDLFQAAYEIRAVGAQRSRFNDLAHLLVAQVSVRTWPDTEVSLQRVVADLPGVNSGRTSALLRRITRQIEGEPASAPSAVTDAAARLARLLDHSR
jgi:hypothetical protein